MILLPAIHNKIQKRPGTSMIKTSHVVPNPEYEEFWTALYAYISSRATLTFPIEDGMQFIDPFFGYFGSRFSPTQKEPNNYHLGIDISVPVGKEVHIITEGVLEYSGYDILNGLYIMVSHPQIKTEDGYMLYSLYMHLKSAKIRFSRKEKMLREISLHSYPRIELAQNHILGTVGNTGIDDVHPHLHVQCEFRKHRSSITVAVDPLRLFTNELHVNRTSEINNPDDYSEFCKKHSEEMRKWGLQVYM